MTHDQLPPADRAAAEHTFHALGLPIPPNPALDGPDRLTLRDPDGRPSLTITHGGTPGTAASLHLHTPAGTWGARLTADEARDAADVLTRLAGTPDPLPCGCENPLNAVHLLDH